MSQADSGVYIQGAFSEPMNIQHSFANHYNMGDPGMAMTSYARIMHQHTQQQLEMATRSARRRSQGQAVSPPRDSESISPDCSVRST